MKDEVKQILEIITQMQDIMVTKSDLETMATKSDLETMATKSDLEAVKADIMTLQSDMAEMGRSLHADIMTVHEELSARLDNHDGFTKEIDHVLDRVTNLEKFVGYTPTTS